MDVTIPDRLAEIEAFLTEAARYFEKRPTGGEDMAHWANVYNAENCRKAAAFAREQGERIAELEKAIKVQANATRTLHQLGIERTRHLEKRDRSEYFAAKTLDSEREANALLTARVEELEAENERLRNDPAVKAFNPHDGGNRD